MDRVSKRKAGFLIGSGADMYRDSFRAIYTPEVIARIGALYELDAEPVCIDELRRHAGRVAEWEVVFGNWGFPPLSGEELGHFCGLRHVFYAGGSVKAFAPRLLEAGIGVTSAKDINSRLVADYCDALIYLALKGHFQALRAYAEDRFAKKHLLTDKNFSGVDHGPVALIGFGAIGTLLARRLVDRGIEVMVVDPYAEPRQLRACRVSAVDLATAMGEARVVSNHLPDLDDLDGYFGAKQFKAMPPNATFINTGRGRQVDHDVLFEIFSGRPDLTAILDVTTPISIPMDHPLRDLPNVILVPHIAGCVGRDLEKLAEPLIDAAGRYERDGYPTVTESTADWAVMA